MAGASRGGAPGSTPASLRGRDHAATGQLLAASGTARTSLHNGFHAHSLTWFGGTLARDGCHHRARVWTARQDAAEVAAVILAPNGANEGPTTLTANSAPTFAEIAAIGSEISEGGSSAWSWTRGMGPRRDHCRAPRVRDPLHPGHVPGCPRRLDRRDRSAARRTNRSLNLRLVPVGRARTHRGEVLGAQQRAQHLARKQLGVQRVLRAMGDQRGYLAVERSVDVDSEVVFT